MHNETAEEIQRHYNDSSNFVYKYKYDELNEENNLIKKYLCHLVNGGQITYEINEWYIKHTIKVKEDKQRLVSNFELSKKMFLKEVEELERKIYKLGE